jgi:WD repeat-containing protein mio
MNTFLFPSASSEASINRRGKASSRRGKSPTESTYGDFQDAVVTLLERSGIAAEKDRPGTLRGSNISSNKIPQRRLALRLCGWTVGDDDIHETIKRWHLWIQVIQHLSYSGVLGGSARERSVVQHVGWYLPVNMRVQQSCWWEAKVRPIYRPSNSQINNFFLDQTHLMLSGTLTALTSLSSDPTKRGEVQKLCERLVLRLEDSYLRAAVTHLLYEEWRDVLDELAPLPLAERLVVALYFLEDGPLSSFLRRSAEQCRTDGNIEGLLITGLTPAGLGVLQTWLDRAGGDVQSAALLGALVVPARIRDPRVERWVTAYRDLMDGWKMFHYRIAFDIERGELARKTTRELAGPGAPPPQIDWAPKQIIIRCNYCNKPVSAPEAPSPYNGRVSLYKLSDKDRL